MAQEDKYVLLIDDEPDFMETIAFWLRSKGYVVKTATSGEDGVKLIQESLPRLVFLDLNMPEEDGIAVLKRIRGVKKDLPVIMVSAYCADPRMMEANKFGISGIFPKNGTFNELGDVLEVSLRIHKST